MKIKVSEIAVVEKDRSNVDELRTLFLTVRKNTFWWADTTTFNLLDFDKETDGEYILVALRDNHPIGFISIWLAENFVHHLFVDNHYHHHGVGTKLLNHVIDKIGFPLRLKCIETNKLAIDFYTKRGFRVTARGIFNNQAFALMELQQEWTANCLCDSKEQ